MIKRILVPVDFSAPSLQALEYGVALGRRLKTELVVLHVVETGYYPFAGGLYRPASHMSAVYQAFEDAGRERLARLTAQLQQRRITARTVLVVGIGHQAIVDTAKKLKADLIVMSTHGRSGLSHLLMGSVAEKVLRTAACPVLTVRGATTEKRRHRRTSPRPA